MQDIWLIRHAQSQENLRQADYVAGRSSESPLSVDGEQQARRLGHWLSQQGVIEPIVYVSPAVRAQRTASLALSAAGIYGQPMYMDERLHELSQGEAEGQLRSTVYTPQVLGQINRQQLDHRHKGGESMNDGTRRMQSWLADIHAIHTNDETVMAFGHGLAIRCLVGSLSGWDHADILRNGLANTAATRLQYQGVRLVSVEFGINTQG